MTTPSQAADPPGEAGPADDAAIIRLDELVVSEALHQHDPGACDAGGIPAGGGRLAENPWPGSEGITRWNASDHYLDPDGNEIGSARITAHYTEVHESSTERSSQ